MNMKTWFTNWKNTLLQHRSSTRKRRSKAQRQPAVTEILEQKTLLTGLNCLGQIEGTMFQDLTENGLTGDDIRIGGATVHLYLDGGNGTFESSDGVAGGDDTVVTMTTTNAVTGEYAFSDLAAGTYHVEQDSGLAGFIQRPGADVSTIVISAADAQGTPGTIIDSFADPSPAQTVSATAGSPASSVAAIVGVGGERDLQAEQSGANALSTVEMRANNIPGFAEMVTAFGTSGIGRVSWDGADGDPDTIDPTGLGGIDLTSAGDSTGILVDIGASNAVTQMNITVFTDGTNFSTATATIPDTGAITTESVFLTFATDFAVGGGTGADFTNVGAIELEFDATAQPSTTVVAGVIQAHGPTAQTANFVNLEPMTLGGTVFEDTNNSGTFQTGTESGLDGVDVTLFEDTNGNGTFDGGDTQLNTGTTAGGGNFSFTNLFPGEYIVRIDSGNFAALGPLENLMSSTGNGTAPDPDNDVSDDDNGDHIGGVTTDAVVSQAITLANQTEPTNDGDADNNTNLSLDFGIFGMVDIEVLKSDNADPITAGSGAGNLVYTVTARNNGPSNATGVTVSDALVAALPTGWSLVSAVGSGTTTFAGSNWTIGNLNSGASETLTVTVTVDASAAAGTTNNIATVTAVNEPESTTANNTATEPTTVQRQVDIAVTKTDNVDPVTAGSGAGNLVYTVTATNNGPSNATGVTVSDALIATLPTGWSLVSAVGSGTTTFAGSSWTIGNLNSGASETLTVTITVGANAANGTTNNIVAVTAVNETDTNAANDSATEPTTVQRQVDIAVTKTDNVDPVTAGSGAGNLVYTVTATNNGPSNATGVTVSDALITALPTGWSLVSAVGSGTTTFAGSSWTIGNLANGASETLTVTITVGANAASGTTNNVVAVTAVNETDTNAANDTATEPTTVQRQVDIAVTKTDNVDPITAGSGTGNLIYTVTATNNGPSDATGVVVSDALIAALPTGWSLVSAVGSGTTTFAGSNWTIGNLANGASETLTVTITVGVGAANGTTTNTATVTAVNETDTNAANNTTTEDTTVNRMVDVQVTKSDNVDPVTAGSGIGNLVYTVTATNNGPSDATGVAVTDALIASLPAGWSLVSAVGSGTTTFAAGTGVWSIGNLANGASETLTVTITVGSAAATGVTTNTATVSAVNETDSNPANNTDSEDTTIGRQVDIGVTKTDNVDPVTAGSGAGNLIYTVTATNNGPSDATGVAVGDALIASLPADWSLVSAVGSGTTTFANGTGIWTIGNLASGASETLTLTLTVGSAAAAGTTTNTATVTSVTQTDTNTANNTATEDTTVIQSVDIALTKADNVDPVTAGSSTGNLVYTVTATNNGPSNATGVTVSDTFLTALPTGFSLVSAIGTGTTTYTGGTWNIGNLNTGATETLTITLTVGAEAASGTVTNTVTVSNINQTDTNTANNTANEDTTINRQVDIAVTKSDNIDPVTAGSGPGNLVYTVTAQNNGPSNASGVAVTDALIASLPTGFSLVSATGSSGTSFNSTNGIWTIGNLNNGASETLTITLTAGASVASGTITNTATVSSINETDTNPANNTDDEDTTINRQVDIAVTKSDSADPVVAGSGAGNLIYTIVATNNGPSDASGVVVTDALIASLPTGISFVSATGSGSTTFNSNTGAWTIGNLSSGSSATLSITVTVGVAVQSSSITNNVTVTGLNETDPNPTNDMFDEPTTFTREVDIGVTKNDSNDPVVAGSGTGNLVYTLVAANNGPSSATGVEITDALLANLPTGISFVSVTSTGGSTFNSSTGVWSIGNLAANDTRQLTVTLTVGADVAAGTITNVATVTNVNETDTNPVNDTDTETTTINREVDLVVTKTDQVDPITSPDIITYTITVENQGPSTATNVILTDNLSTQVTFASVATSQGTAVENGGVLTAMLGTLPVGSVATITLIVDVDQPDGATITNITTVTATETETNTSNNTDDEITIVQPAPSSVSGIVYEDLNNNGVRDPGENPIPGARVGLFGTDINNNAVIRFVETDANGAYLFANLTRGNYNLFEIQPAAREDRGDAPGTGAGNAIIASNDAFAGLNLAAGANGVAFNFGEGPIDEEKRDFLASNQQLDQELLRVQAVAGTGSLSGRVVYDNNANGVVDGSDFGLGGVTVALVGTDNSANANPVLIYRTTAGDGTYTFDNLAAGTYSIVESQPPGFNDGTDIAGTLLPGTILDDVFGAIALPDGVSGTGYQFLEIPLGVVAAGGGQAPVLAAQAAATNAASTVSWAPVANAVRYDLWLSQITDGVGLVYRNQNVAGTTLELPAGLNLAEHRLWVRGVDAQGRAAAWSEPLTFNHSPAIDIISPNRTTIDTTPNFDWTDVGNATSYDFMLQDTAGNEIISATGLTASSYIPASRLAPGSYRFWIRARNGGFTGDWSTAREFTIDGTPTPLAPVTASVLAAPMLEWTDSGADYYEVWVNDVTNGSSFVCLEQVQGTSMLMDHGLVGGNRYRYWVRGMDNEGNASTWSSPQTFTLDSRTEITSPTGNVASGNINMTWNPVPGATHYYVWISNGSGAYIRDQNVVGTSYTPATPLPDGDYRAWVQAFGVNGSNNWSRVAKFSVGGLSTPTLVSPSASTADRTPTFAWNAVSGADRYELWVNHLGVTSRVIHETAVTATSFTSASTLAAGNYRVWVRALGNAGQQSAWTSAFDLTIT